MWSTGCRWHSRSYGVFSGEVKWSPTIIRFSRTLYTICSNIQLPFFFPKCVTHYWQTYKVEFYDRAIQSINVLLKLRTKDIITDIMIWKGGVRKHMRRFRKCMYACRRSKYDMFHIWFPFLNIVYFIWRLNMRYS